MNVVTHTTHKTLGQVHKWQQLIPFSGTHFFDLCRHPSLYYHCSQKYMNHNHNIIYILYYVYIINECTCYIVCLNASHWLSCVISYLTEQATISEHRREWAWRITAIAEKLIHPHYQLHTTQLTLCGCCVCSPSLLCLWWQNSWYQLVDTAHICRNKNSEWWLGEGLSVQWSLLMWYKMHTDLIKKYYCRRNYI